MGHAFSRLVTTIATGAVVFHCAWQAAADPLTPFKGESRPVTFEDIRPHFDRDGNSNNEYYSEWWSFVFKLEGGYSAYLQFLVSNLGPGDGKAVVRASLDLPDGFHLDEKMEYEQGDWEYAKEGFKLSMGDNSVGGPMDALTITLKNESFEAEYKLRSSAPPWKPGSGRVKYGAGQDRFMEFQVIAPSAVMNGRVRVVGEDEWRPVKGVMYVDHTLATIGMHEQARRWIRYRYVDSETTFLLADIRPPDIYGDETIQYAVLFHDGKKVFDTLDFKMKMGRRYTDPKKEGYFAARLVEFQSQDGDVKAHGAIRAVKMTNREDYLETVGAAKRFIISKFARPVMYYFNGVFALEIAENVEKKTRKRKFGGKGRYYYTVVNP